MKYLYVIFLFAICMRTYSQNEVCFLDSLISCKDEIEKLERFNYKKLRKFPAYRKYSNLKQLHFFWVKSKTYCPITNEEFLLGFISSLPQLAWEKGSDVFVVNNQ